MPGSSACPTKASYGALAAAVDMRHAFSAPPWKEIYETDIERKQDFAEVERTFEPMARVYRQCGYQLSELPKLTPAARAKFILEQLHLTTLPNP